MKGGTNTPITNNNFIYFRKELFYEKANYQKTVKSLVHIFSTHL